MRMVSSCVLIGFRPDAHEVGTDPVAVRRTVKCQEMGISLAEKTQAEGTGLAPGAKLLIPYDRDYRGERELEYRGERWAVIFADPYKEYNGVILSIRRKKGNAGDPSAPPHDDTQGTEVGE